MATYNNQYSMKVTPNKPTLRGIDTNYDSTGQINQGGIGLGDLYQLDYDRNKIEQVFNQGTDAQYALMQKENQIAQNQYANNQFANQQSAIETLRQQRNEQISSGMARGLNAAQEQGTILGLQQEASAGALELANQRQLEADKIAVEYANNVAKALQEANAVKQAMAGIAAQMYEADMLGYTGELGYLGQMDANASDRYGYDIGLEGTKYSADKGLEGTKYNADMNYKGAVDAANINAAATKAAAATTAAAYKNSGGGGGSGNSYTDENFIEYCYKTGKTKEGMIAALQAGGTYTEAQARTLANQYYKTVTNYLAGTNQTLYFDSNDGTIKATQTVNKNNSYYDSNYNRNVSNPLANLQGKLSLAK